MKIEGKKVVNIDELIDVFEAQEGSVESYTGGVGEGKTYGATRRAIHDLEMGRVVYTNWQLLLDDFTGDQRKSFFRVLTNFLFFKKRFYNIDIKKNWHFFDMEDDSTWIIGTKMYDDVVEFIADLTDCVVYLDEGQDIFDSYEGTKMSKKKRKTITRTRHLHKTLVVMSQRYQAIPPTARANVKTFYRHYKTMSWPFLHFKVYATSEIDNTHMPMFDMEGKADETYWGKKKILNAYNSYYLREGIPRSQEVFFEAYDFSFKERFHLLLSFLPQFRLKPKLWGVFQSLGVKFGFTTLKTDIRKDLRPSDTKKSVFMEMKPDKKVSAQHAISAESSLHGLPF